MNHEDKCPTCDSTDKKKTWGYFKYRHCYDPWHGVYVGGHMVADPTFCTQHGCSMIHGEPFHGPSPLVKEEPIRCPHCGTPLVDFIWGVGTVKVPWSNE